MMRSAPVFSTAQAAEEAFYDAMQRGDLPGMMSLWADDDEAVCVHPNGARLVGVQAIRASFEEIFAQGGVDVRIAGAHIQQGAMIAVHNVIEKILVSGRMGTEVVECIATNVYVNSPGGWHIVLHHASPAGERSDPELPVDTSTLH